MPCTLAEVLARGTTARGSWRTAIAWVAVAVAVAVFPAAARAQAVKVEELRRAGQLTEQVDAVLIITAEAPDGIRRRVRRDEQFTAGFEIVAPPAVIIVLRSVNGNRIVLEPGARLRVADVTQAGERYLLRLGSALFEVLKALSFFNVEFDETFSAQVRGTTFRITGEKGDGAPRFTCEVLRGQVLVKRPERMQIAGQVVTAQTAVLLGSELQPKIVWSMSDVERVRSFASLDEAEGYLRERLLAARAEPIEVALTLGGLAAASGDRERALRIYQAAPARDAPDPRVAELNLRTGDLLAQAGQRNEALLRYDIARKVYNQVYTPDASRELAHVLTREGDLYSKSGQRSLATRKYRESARVVRRATTVHAPLQLQQQIDPGAVKLKPQLRQEMLRQDPAQQ